MAIIFLFLFLLPVFLCIGYFFYKQREDLFTWLLCLAYYYVFLFIGIWICQDPIIEHKENLVSKQGIIGYEYSNPKKFCPWGGKYYTVVRTDTLKPEYDDCCIHCGETYHKHGDSISYKNKSEYIRDYNWSILLDYATSGNN